MNMPGFVAEASLPNRNDPCFVTVASMLIRVDTTIIPAQFNLPPILCPVELEPTLVKSGGERVCTRMMQETCINSGTPWERCYPARCIEWGISPIEYRWECHPKPIKFEPLGIGRVDFG